MKNSILNLLGINKLPLALVHERYLLGNKIHNMIRMALRIKLRCCRKSFKPKNKKHFKMLSIYFSHEKTIISA